jgi:hypothetical protein
MLALTPVLGVCRVGVAGCCADPDVHLQGFQRHLCSQQDSRVQEAAQRPTGQPHSPRHCPGACEAAAARQLHTSRAAASQHEPAKQQLSRTQCSPGSPSQPLLPAAHNPSLRPPFMCTHCCGPQVGWDDVGGFWLARNSWGKGFADGGYFRVRGRVPCGAGRWVAVRGRAWRFRAVVRVGARVRRPHPGAAATLHPVSP